MQIVRSHERKIMRWKNGGGETAEIAVRPQGAGLDDFDWRLSTARVASDGPFSRFTGIDRTLAVLEGEGLRISIDGLAPVTLTRDTRPVSFPADASVEAVLVRGPIVDLNVMTRRGRFLHRVKRVEFSAPATLEPIGSENALHCWKGYLRVETAESSADLSAGDTLVGAERGTWWLTSQANASGYLVEIIEPA